jgi:hypothetical protein
MADQDHFENTFEYEFEVLFNSQFELSEGEGMAWLHQLLKRMVHTRLEMGKPRYSLELVRFMYYSMIKSDGTMVVANSARRGTRGSFTKS